MRAAGLERDLARELPPRIHAELARARDAYNELIGMVDTPPNRRGGAPAPAPARRAPAPRAGGGGAAHTAAKAAANVLDQPRVPDGSAALGFDVPSGW